MTAFAPVADTTIVTDGADLLITKYKNRTLFKAWLATYTQRLQEGEDLVQQLFTVLSIETSVGVWLDLLGRIVGQPRTSTDDDVYRIHVKARIRINISHGTENDIQELAFLLLAASDWRTFDVYPNEIRVNVNDSAGNEGILAGLFKEALAAGKRLRYEYSTSSRVDVFTLKHLNTRATVIPCQFDFPKAFDNVAWVPLLLDTISDGGTDPDGGTDSFEFLEIAGTNVHIIADSLVGRITGAAVEYRVYAKAGDLDIFYLRDLTSGGGTQFFLLASGTLGSATSVDSATITDVGGGWFLCTMLGSPTGATAPIRIGTARLDNQQSYPVTGGDERSMLFFNVTAVQTANEILDTPDSLTAGFGTGKLAGLKTP